MTPEAENVLFSTLGRLEAKLDAANATFLLHTDQDAENFKNLEDGQDQFREALTVLKLAAARAEGNREAAAKYASMHGRNWGAFSGGFVSIIIAALAAFFNSR